jgi:hypothetical protein
LIILILVSFYNKLNQTKNENKKIHSIIYDKMKGISVREFGGPENCKISNDLPIPEPNDNQVIKIIHFYQIKNELSLKQKTFKDIDQSQSCWSESS